KAVLASTSVCFDLSILEMFMPLSWGGKIVVVEKLIQLISARIEDQITLINTVPSAITELIRAGRMPSTVKVVNLAGEPLQRGLVDQVFAQRVERVLNLYGPTEDTTYSTYREMKRDEKGSPTIGGPIANTQVYILDSKG